jgi:hypothetical protein
VTDSEDFAVARLASDAADVPLVARRWATQLSGHSSMGLSRVRTAFSFNVNSFHVNARPVAGRATTGRPQQEQARKQGCPGQTTDDRRAASDWLDRQTASGFHTRARQRRPRRSKGDGWKTITGGSVGANVCENVVANVCENVGDNVGDNVGGITSGSAGHYEVHIAEPESSGILGAVDSPDRYSGTS